MIIRRGSGPCAPPQHARAHERPPSLMTTTDTRTPCLVIICGEIDIATTGNLRDALTTALTRGPHIEADLSAVTFMDASGIGVLLAARRQAAEAGGSLTLRAPSAVVRRLTEILGLDEVLPVSG